MTEDEAKTKWCPFARVVENGKAVPAHNRVQNKDNREIRVPIAGDCIASKCMAWRWDEAPSIGYRLNPDKPNLTDRPGSGHCGVAGH